MADVELQPVYLIVGSDRPKVATAIARLRRHFAPEAIEHVAAQEASGADVVALCNAGSLFGDRRLVLVDDVDGRPNADGQLRNAWKAADLDAVVDYLGAPAPGTTLTLTASALKADAKLAKSCTKAGQVLRFDIQKKELVSWVGKQFKERGVAADREACSALVQVIGDDLDALASEVEKIALWADGEPVGEAEVQRLAAPLADTPVYAITDAWGRRDASGALEATELALDRSPRPPSATVPMIAAQLARQVGVVRRARRLEEQGVSPRDAIERLGVRFPFQAERAYGFGRNFSDGELEWAVLRLAALDHALKGGSRLRPEVELQRALVDVIEGPPHERAPSRA